MVEGSGPFMSEKGVWSLTIFYFNSGTDVESNGFVIKK